MSENLSYDTLYSNKDSFCYDSLESNCELYGRLYSWSFVMKVSTTYNSTRLKDTINHRGICPEGWHVPRNGEWQTMIDYVNADNGDADGDGSTTDDDVGYSLKSTFGWYNDKNGDDPYGFSALPGGRVIDKGDSIIQKAGQYGYWWTATEDGSVYNGNSAYLREIYYGLPNTISSTTQKVNALSLRCVKD